MSHPIYKTPVLFTLLLVSFLNCKNPSAEKKEDVAEIPEHSLLKEQPTDIPTPEGMVWVEG
ncbi:MAG: hypothetical protein WA749_14485, partial [Gelidibacter sp.]